MSKNPKLNSENVLPPNVKGKQRGFLEIELTDLIWESSGYGQNCYPNRGCSKTRNPDHFIGSGGVSIKLIWWGENPKTGGVVIQVPGHSGKLKEKTIRYSVNTSPSLFQKYLSTSEPIEITFTANTSHLHIGTALVRAPSVIIQGCYSGAKETVGVNRYRILSAKNTVLGSLEIKFKMVFYENVSSARSSVCKDSNELKLDLDDLELCKSYKNFRDGNTPRSYPALGQKGALNGLSPRILRYLSGVDMSPQEEETALEEIHRTSPITCLVDEVLIDPFKKIHRDNLSAQVDCLRLTVKNLNLLPAGAREVYNSSSTSISFTIECRIVPNLLGDSSSPYDCDIMRFYSNPCSDKTYNIYFDKTVVRAVKIARRGHDSLDVDQCYLLFTVWWRQFGSKHSRCLGSTMCEFTHLIKTVELEETRKLPVKSCTKKIHVADLTCKVTLGTRGVHFGPDLMEIIKEDSSNCSGEAERDTPPFCTQHTEFSIKDRPKIRKTIDEDDVDKASSSTHSSSPVESSKGPSKSAQANQSTQTLTNARNTKDSQENGMNVGIESPLDIQSYRLLQGLLYVGALRNIKDIDDGGYFLVCRAFWKEDVTSTDFAQNNVFNFLEVFPILNDQKFLERARNNHLNLELWQKTVNTPEQMVGIIRLPLHQFFIAFRDSTITNHLCQGKLPVISIDGWAPIASPLSSEICGQLQSLLAIGTEEQLEYLKASRGLNLNRVCETPMSDFYGVQVPVPPLPKLPIQSDYSRPLSCDVEVQTTPNESDVNDFRRERLSDLLGNFIDNLVQKLPADRQASTSGGEDTSIAIQGSSSSAKLRKTSDLLDVLQKALVAPPNQATVLTGRSHSEGSIVSPITMPNKAKQQSCKVLLEIECALHLPRTPVKLGNKKSTKRSSGNKMKQSRQTFEEEPSTYVTFQADDGYGQMFKSHEGFVYCTHVVEKSCSPSWMKRFEIAVPADLLVNDEKRFILKVWRKSTTDLAQCRLLPSPMEDTMIGFVAVDLNVLLSRMLCISGWFNIVDLNGKVNGQIKLTVQPLEDVMKFKEIACISKIPATMPEVPVDLGSSVPDLQNTSLSRAIKRKFSELEEITQRLRARLFDVTGEPVAGAVCEVEDAQVDEFERDINTTAEEDQDDDINGRQNFGWLGCVPSNLDGLQTDNSSVTSGGSHERIQMISEFLRKTDLNEVNEISYDAEARTSSDDDDDSTTMKTKD